MCIYIHIDNTCVYINKYIYVYLALVKPLPTSLVASRAARPTGPPNSAKRVLV